MKYKGLDGKLFIHESTCIENIRTKVPCFGNIEEKNEFITSEYCANIGLEMMNTSSAYVNGASGEGIVVAVIDSMVDSTHKELVNNYSSASKQYTNDYLSKDYASHGTKIAGIIVGAKDDDINTVYDGVGMHGVAYNAEILSLGTLASDGSDYKDIAHAINYATINDADVINMSMGGYNLQTDKESKAAYMNALFSDVTVVLSAGNNSKDCKTLSTCVLPASLPFNSGFDDLLNGDGGWIIVGGVNSSGKMTSYSNKAGITKNNYVVALGEDTYTSTLDNDYFSVNGTSFTTPYISGVVALMKGRFPYLSGKQIANIIFKTCTDLGEKGVDDVYGHGLVNVKKAFELAATY